MEPSRDVDLRAALRRRWALVAALTLLGAVTGFAVSAAMTPVYEGTASLLVGNIDSGNISMSQIQAMQSLATTYADVARREPVLSGAARDLHLRTSWGELRSSVHITVPNDSPRMIEIVTEGSNRERVKDLAQAIKNRLVRYVNTKSSASSSHFLSPQLERLQRSIIEGEKRVSELQRSQKAASSSASAGLESAIRRTQAQIGMWQSNYASLGQLAAASSHVAISTLDPATATRSPVRPNVRFNTLMAASVGFLLGMAISYLLESRRGPAAEAQTPAAPAGTDRQLNLSPRPGESTMPVADREARASAQTRVGVQHEEGVR